MRYRWRRGMSTTRAAAQTMLGVHTMVLESCVASELCNAEGR